MATHVESYSDIDEMVEKVKASILAMNHGKIVVTIQGADRDVIHRWIVGETEIHTWEES